MSTRLEREKAFPQDCYVVDIGMNNGEDSEYYAKRGFKVFAVEANPVLANRVVEKFGDTEFHIEVLNKAVSNTEGTLPFYVNKLTDKWSSLLEQSGSRLKGSDKIEVQGCNLAIELAPFCESIYYAKIDIEGYDLIALDQVLELPVVPQFVSIENGSRSAIEKMKERGYTRFKYSNQKFVEQQKIPSDTDCGHLVDHDFEFGSSGLFGNDLRGKWLSYEEALVVSDAFAAAMKIASQVNLWAEAVGWFDLHAGKGNPGWR